MKKILLIGLMICAHSVFAVNADDVPIRPSKPIQARMEPMGITSQGLRLGISKALLNGRLNAFSQDAGNVTNDYGLSVGYAYIPTESFGFLGHVIYSQYSQNYSKDVRAIRVDANAAYSFKENVYGFAGLNINKFVDGADAGVSDAKTKIGYQIGAGFQFNSMFGVDVQYVWINNKYYADDAHMEGIDFVLHATF